MSERETIRTFFIEHNPGQNWVTKREIVKLLSGRIRVSGLRSPAGLPAWALFGLMLFDLPRGNRLASTAIWRELYTITANYYNIVVGAAFFNAPRMADNRVWQPDVQRHMLAAWQPHEVLLKILVEMLNGTKHVVTNGHSIAVHKITDVPLDQLTALFDRVNAGAISGPV